MRVLLIFVATILLSTGAFSQQTAPDDAPTPEGIWRDQWGTTLSISYCGEDDSGICVILLDVFGESRTEANLAYVNKQIMQAERVAGNQWRGTVIFEGNEAEGTLTQVAPDIVEIQGCRALILCETIAFQRV